MRTSIIALSISSLLLAGCGGGSVGTSRYNPVNWFGKDRAPEAVSTEVGEKNPLIPERQAAKLKSKEAVYLGTSVEKITALRLEAAPGGRILRVEAVAQTQRAFDVRLIAEPSDEGTLVYTLKAAHPDRAAYGPDRSRKITAALFLTDQDLRDIKTVRVAGTSNALSVRR
ncbi:hypothetical protein [Litorivita sp. NS0012-18]|uniref:hypothetical protein n=1 Tax=Litorivita sp. NS0012-18 TaxID=3127655 RepID=UPI00310C0366